jgi:hypothetical protein
MPPTVPLSPQTFHPFPRLAAELQLRIWTLFISALLSRVVPLRDGFWTTLQLTDDLQAIISTGGQIANTTDAETQKWEWQYTSPCSIPAPLHTCSLSRELALKRWRLAFAEEDGEGKIFFDFERDVLWIGEKLPDFKEWLKAVGRGERKGVRTLAIDFDVQLLPRNFRSGAGIAAVLMNEFPLLEKVVLVGSERTAEDGRAGDAEEDPVRLSETKGDRFTFVQNVDGSEDAFRYTHGAELDAFREVYKLEGRHHPELKYMDYTREDPELFKYMDKLRWLQIKEE